MFRRNIQRAVLDALSDTPVILVNGARQTGKTTLCRKIGEEAGARFFTLDDYATLASARNDPSGFIGNLVGPVVIDEVQKAPELFSAIKLSVDRDRRPGRFLLTGSANVMTLPHLSDSLAGRMEVIPLFPLSAGELEDRTEGFMPLFFGGKGIPLTLTCPPCGDIAARIARGGYPEAVQRRDRDRRAVWFSSYLSTILQRDVRDLARVDALVALPNLLKTLAARSAGLLNLAEVSRDISLPHSTLTRHLALLETIFLVHRLPAWSRNLGRRLIKAPKVHLLDTGLACNLLGVDERKLAKDRSLLGHLLESYVVGELRKQIAWSSPQTALFHFRSSAGAEVDVIAENPDGAVLALEIKATATVGAAEFAALQTLRETLGEAFRAGIVLYLGEQVVPFGDRLWLVPVSALWTG
jgi:predicted AAA+ superfamily ATPase